MSVKHSKLWLIALKCAVAAALLVWVLAGVSLHSHVVGVDGKVVAVDRIEFTGEGSVTLIRPDGLSETVAAGRLRPVDSAAGLTRDNYLRPGLVDVIKRLSPVPLMLALTLLGASYLVGAWRWHGLVTAAGMRMAGRTAVRLTWIGLLFNNVVLGTTGGDLAKAYYLFKAGHSRTASLLSVLADRIFGLVSLVLLALVSLLAMIGLSGSDTISEGFYGRLIPALAVVGVAFAGVVVFSILLVRVVEGRLLPGFLRRLIERFSLEGALGRAVGVLKLYGGVKRVIPAALLRSLLMQMLFILSIWQMACALRLDIPVTRFVVFVPLIYMIAAVPLTPGAVGVVEGLYVGFFADWASRGEMLILALLVRLAILAWSLPGLAAMMGGHLNRREMEDISAFHE